MKDYKFTPTVTNPIHKTESQDQAQKIEDGEAEWRQIGEYSRTLPGRKLNFKDHGEVLRIETQKEWDEIVADAEDEIFTRMQHHDNRLCPERELEPITMETIDEKVSYYHVMSHCQFDHHLNDIEANGKDAELHQESLKHEEKGFYAKLNYFLRDDILCNETNLEFEAFRDGRVSGYKTALADSAYIENEIPELCVVRDQLRKELIEAVRNYFIKEWGEDEITDDTAKLIANYGLDKSIAQLVKMKAGVEAGKLV